MSENRAYKITMSNTGGELDHVMVTASEADAGQKLKTALLELIEDCASIEPGDTFSITEI